MNKKELVEKLTEKNIPKDIYSVSGGLPNECFCLNYGERWEVYYSEKGVKKQLFEFDTEDAACKYLFDKLLKVFNL